MADKTDAQWQAEEDARTLARAEEIKSNTGRMDRARAAAKEMLYEEEKRLIGLKKISGKQSPSNTVRTGTKYSTPSTSRNKSSQVESSSAPWQNR